jgi:hypothetical protein
LAEDTHELYFRKHPLETDREYFEHVFREVGKIPAARDLFAEGKTPLWAIGPSGDMAMRLLGFLREIDAEKGHLKRSFEVEDDDTRFLGDLYQELSERAKKRFALLQTPVFVEEFILDRTLTPAIAEFGLETVRMIDPTCGSGHFLLGGFARLFKLWSKPEHTTGNAETDAQKALDGVWGVDINPFAVAIARFRLIVAAVQACGIKRLKLAPGWSVHLAEEEKVSGTVIAFLGTPLGTKRTFQAQASYGLLGPEFLPEGRSSIHRAPQRQQLSLRLRRIDLLHPVGQTPQRPSRQERTLLGASLVPAVQASPTPVLRALYEVGPQRIPLHVPADREEVLVVLYGK